MNKFYHFGNKYILDEESGIYYQNLNKLEHFKKIVRLYPYYNFLSQYINIFLEKDNNMHTSFFDCESMCIHLLHRHIERYTVIHELNHCLQYLCDLSDDDDLADTIFNLDEPLIVDMDYEVLKYINDTKSSIREPAVALIDIINSCGKGCYAQIINTKSHIPSYYNADIGNWILEAHSNYVELYYNNETDMIKKIPKKLLKFILKYDKLIQKRTQKLLEEEDE